MDSGRDPSATGGTHAVEGVEDEREAEVEVLAALWFFKLFRRENDFAAGSIAAFGLVNAAAILVATVFSASALAVAGDGTLAAGGDQAATVQSSYHLHGTTWEIGGVSYVVGTYLTLVAPDVPSWLGDVLTGGVATIGELWMIGYLLLIGVRSPEKAPVPVAARS